MQASWNDVHENIVAHLHTFIKFVQNDLTPRIQWQIFLTHLDLANFSM